MTRRDRVNIHRGKWSFVAMDWWGNRSRRHSNRWNKRYAWRVVRREDALAARREIEEHEHAENCFWCSGDFCRHTEDWG